MSRPSLGTPRVRAHRAAIAIAAMVCGAPAGAAADTLVTVAGTGTAGSLGDGSMAAAAQLNGPRGLARLGDGSILVADTVDNRIRRIAPDGTITTVAGTGTPAAWATAARRSSPSSTARVTSPSRPTASPTSSPTPAATASAASTPPATITTVAGSGTAGFAGDGGSATLASLNGPSGVAVTPTGGLLIADTTNNRIRPWSAPTSSPRSRATARPPRPATAAPRTSPRSTCPRTSPSRPAAAYLIADTAGNRIRRVDAGGTITTVAGTGTACAATTSLCGDYGPAVLAQLNAPRVRRRRRRRHRLPRRRHHATTASAASAADGTITTLVGSGTACALSTSLCGDAGPGRDWRRSTRRAASSSFPTASRWWPTRARTDCAPASPTASSRTAGPRRPRRRHRPDRTRRPAGTPGASGGGRDERDARRQLAVAFASTKLTARAARATKLRIVLTSTAVVRPACRPLAAEPSSTRAARVPRRRSQAVCSARPHARRHATR